MQFFDIKKRTKIFFFYFSKIKLDLDDGKVIIMASLCIFLNHLVLLSELYC